MKYTSASVVFAFAALAAFSSLVSRAEYAPEEWNLKARRQFADQRFGVFIHWGLYANYAQGEWYLKAGADWKESLDREAYERMMHGFYPSKFDAREWVKTIAGAGAKYVTITSRHHDGFSLWPTKVDDGYNVAFTPFKRDVLGELKAACDEAGLQLNFYYSLMDWHRKDYPAGDCAVSVLGKQKGDYKSYKKFMLGQIDELITRYRPGNIWFDGEWEHARHQADGTWKRTLDWQFDDIYDFIHSKHVLVANNNHQPIRAKEDIQLFERDLPGDDSDAGFSKNQPVVNDRPVEQCDVIQEGVWGYRIANPKFRTPENVVAMVARAAAKGSNLLMNIGPDGSGQLPAKAVAVMNEVGKWFKKNGESIYGTDAGGIASGKAVVSTRKGDVLYLHFLDPKVNEISFKTDAAFTRARVLGTDEKVKIEKTADGKVRIVAPRAKGDAFDVVVALSTAVPLSTVWCEKGAPADAWTEYPRPQMVRANWTNLNGLWDYEVVTNTAAGTPVRRAAGKIRVPYCFESALSGADLKITEKDRMIYRRTLDLRPKAGTRILLNFEAVDYSAQVFLNGAEVTDVPHEGGNLPFSVDLTPFAKNGPNALEVRVWDPTGKQYGGHGKQCRSPGGCFYTRVSGIWQTVWLEEVPEEHVTSFAVDMDLDAATATFRVESSKAREAAAEVAILDGGREVARGVAGKPIKIPGALKLWSPDKPNLYGYEMRLGADRTTGYFAMRKSSTVEDRNGDLRFALNDEVFYPLATLDQGWWPDGLLTPPCDAAMRHDILTLKKCGFNTMRKHIKVEPRRYYYLCDVLGMAVLQDLPSGFDEASGWFDQDFARMRYDFSRREMKEMIDHLRNEPCVLMWIPYNEGWGQPDAMLTREMLRWVKRYDPSRLVNGPSGWNDWEGGRRFKDVVKGWGSGFVTSPCDFDADGKPSSDAVDFHQYPGPVMPSAGGGRVSFLGEYGGLGLKVPGHLWNEKNAWGYAGTGGVTDHAATQARYLKLLDQVRDLVTHGLAGSVYTQTTDVEAEINGLMTYDRKVLKFDAAALKKGHDALLATSWDLGRKGWTPGKDGAVEFPAAGTYRLYAKTAALKAGNPRVDGREIVPAARERDGARTWTYCGDVAVGAKTAKVAFGDLAGIVFMPAGDPMRPPEAQTQADAGTTQAAAAARAFDAPERNARNFNAGWTFAKSGETPRAVDLPHDWAVDYPFTAEVAGNEGRLPYGGRGVYRKSFALAADELKGRTYLEIDGAMCHSSVWLNGRQVSPDRPYGYVSYSVELTKFLRGAGEKNDLEVVLDTPPKSTRYYSGAGLYRDVRLVTVPKFHVAYDGVRIRTKDLPGGRAEVLVDVTVEGAVGPRTLMMDCHVFKDGKPVEMQSRNYVMPDGNGKELPPQTVTMALVVEKPELWSPETPHLYELEIEVLLRNVNYDKVRRRFGIRTPKFDPKTGFSLNGVHRQMKGACLHHDFGPLGGAFHVDAARRQLKLMREMGADSIRTTHNPPDPKLLDLCDEMGFMVMDEAFDMWELPKNDNDYHVEFPAWHERDLEAFVKRDRNHPCVMMWSIGNEVQEHTADSARGYRIGTNLVEILHRHDDRPTTVACWWPGALTNEMHEICEVMGANYLPWWYTEFIENNPDKLIVGTETESVLSSRGSYFFPWPDKANNTHKDDPQPFFYAKADDGHGNWGTRPEVWNRIFRDGQVSGYDVCCYNSDINHPPDSQFKYQELEPRCCGMFTWTGMDYLGEPTPYGNPGEKARSAYFGACDLCGFPKDRFWLFKAFWRPDVPSAHLLPHWNWKAGMTLPVHLYSSGDEAELFVNGKSQGVRKREKLHYRFVWDAVAYEPGEIRAVVKKNGKAWATDAVKTAGAPAKVLQELEYRGDKLAYWKFTVVDKDGVVCPTAAVKLSFKGKLAGVCNGDPTDWTPFKSQHVTTFNGLAQAITWGGELVAEAEGLPVRPLR